MLSATFCFLGIAGFIAAVLACFSMGKPVAATGAVGVPPKRPTWSKKAEWPEIRAAWMLWCLRCQAWEAPKRKTALSWGRTMALCAGLCLIGIVVKVQLDEQTCKSRVRPDFGHRPAAAIRFQRPQRRPAVNRSFPTINRPSRTSQRV